MPDSKEYVSFILSRTQFAANLGAAARIMKNMGFQNLVLVQPECDVGAEARTLAMKGADVLDRAVLLPNFEAAARRCDLLVGTSSRFGPRKPGWTTSRVLAEEIIPGYVPHRIGIAFGSEDNGLRRSEIQLCQWVVEIPTASEYPVLNLAQAVAITAYDLHLGLSDIPRRSVLHEASASEVESMMLHAREMLAEIGYPTRDSLERMIMRLQKIAGRARLEKEDVNLFRGLMRQIKGRAKGE